ncbi:MAG: hypothetical protein M1834_004607 [Cirrosporium novae-zelandiae]|nr:MAG: hypothetical protein M1834_004607 [Cirrosporium novae-zelandiae]
MSLAVDVASAILIIQILLDDIERLTSTSKGKSCQDHQSDTEAALALFRDDLKIIKGILIDRHIAHSIANAVQSDDTPVNKIFLQEQQAIRDHDIACQLSGMGVGTDKIEEYISEDINEDIPAKFGALSVSDQIDEASFRAHFDRPDDSDEGEQVLSSKDKTPQTPEKHQCISYQDETPFFDVTRRPCDDEYCRNCLQDLFSASLIDKSLFPPRCCGKPFDLKPRDPVYFSAQILYKKYITGDIVSCSVCTTTTCTICKSSALDGDCPEDTTLQQLLDTATENRWQHCNSCGKMVELSTAVAAGLDSAICAVSSGKYVSVKTGMRIVSIPVLIRLPSVDLSLVIKRPERCDSIRH